MKFTRIKYCITAVLFLGLAAQTHAQTDGSAIYVNDMDYVLGDVKQAFIQNRISTTAQADSLIDGFKQMKVNGIRVPIFAEGFTPNKAMFDYFFDQALAEGFKIFANPAQHSGGKRIACEMLNGTVCPVLNNNTRTNILIDRIKAFAAEYPIDWINPFNEDGAPGASWSANQMNTIYASLDGNVGGADLIGPGVWGLPGGISVLNGTNVRNHVTVATSHNLGYNHGSWDTFIGLAKSYGLPVWDSEVNNNVSEANNRGTTTRLEAAIAAGVDGLVLYNSWNYISLANGSINNAGQTVMDYFLKFRTDKKYYIQNVGVNKRLAADGSSEEAYGVPSNTTGSDVEWVFVDKGNGYYHIRRAAGGSLPGLRTNGTDFADMQGAASNGVQTYYDFSAGSASESYHITLPDWQYGEGRKRLQMTTANTVKFVTTESTGSWVSYRFIEAGDYDASSSSLPTSSSNTVVHIKKRNALGFAIDGNHGGANDQNVHLWSASEANDNQQWVEIHREGDYYSYQKQGTNFCLDGGYDGANGQNVFLYSCGDTNQNQQWQKIATDSNYFKLQKRNAPGFALDGGSGASNGQNLGLYSSSSASHNLQWSISPITSQ